jgi:anti-sigma regulatory factor (Ser/Thr protein kinase)
MSTSPPQPQSAPQRTEQDGAQLLLSALDTLPAAIYCLDGAGGAVWANARARALGTTRADLPAIDGVEVADAVDEVMSSGRARTISGPLGDSDPVVIATVRPVRLAGEAGALLVIEPLGRDADPPEWPEADAHLVQRVQHALLPDSLPLLPDLALSGSYHPASSLRAAGGDWYDAFPLGRGLLAVAIGDAVGHGVPAAGAMSRLRGAMRSSALRDPSPQAVMAALDDFGAHMHDVEGASILYGVFDVGTGAFSYAAAGHPAPLVVRADGAASFLPVAPRPPLGTVPGTSATVLEHQIQQGETLVLYSDGALVTSGKAVPGGPERLAEVAATETNRPGALEGDGTAALAAAIALGVHESDARLDDVAVLVAHRCMTRVERLEVTLRAVPATLPVIRRRVNAWLGGLGMGEQDRVGVMVAVGEACANAAEHAYRDTAPGDMHLSADVDLDGVLTIVVRDEGSWRPPDRDPGDRGRGLLIMRQMVDRLQLKGQAGTTVTLSLQLRRGPEAEAPLPSIDLAAVVSIDREGQLPVVLVAGVVDPPGAEQMRLRLLEASRGGTTPVELDLTEVGLFCSAGVRVVLAMARIARDGSWRLTVRAPDGGVTRHILEISGLAGLVDLH